MMFLTLSGCDSMKWDPLINSRLKLNFLRWETLGKDKRSGL